MSVIMIKKTKNPAMLKVFAGLFLLLFLGFF